MDTLENVGKFIYFGKTLTSPNDMIAEMKSG
jgi:hypothetical protein